MKSKCNDTATTKYRAVISKEQVKTVRRKSEKHRHYLPPPTKDVRMYGPLAPIGPYVPGVMVFWRTPD